MTIDQNEYLLSRKGGSGIRRGEKMELVGFSYSQRAFDADRAPGYIEETLESAGCTGQCPTYPGAPKTEDGFPDCSKCPQFNEE